MLSEQDQPAATKLIRLERGQGILVPIKVSLMNTSFYLIHNVFSNTYLYNTINTEQKGQNFYQLEAKLPKNSCPSQKHGINLSKACRVVPMAAA